MTLAMNVLRRIWPTTARNLMARAFPGTTTISSSSLLSLRLSLSKTHTYSRLYGSQARAMPEPRVSLSLTGPAESRRITKATTHPGYIEIQWGDGTTDRFSCIWLRDHCRGSGSFDKATNQKIVDTHAIPMGISARSLQISKDGTIIEVVWDAVVQNVKTSMFESDWLQANRHGSQEPGRVPEITWGKEFKDLLPSISVPYTAVLNKNEALLDLLTKVRVHGVAYVTGVPVCKQRSQELVERIGPVRQTFYGGFWETVVKDEGASDNIDSAYSCVALPAHTDGNYWEDPPGLQPDASGGDTLLVDGFKVAQELQRRDPSSFEILCNTPVTFQHLSAQQHVVARHTVFGLDADGRLERFHFNNLDRDTLRLPFEQVDKFYKAWQLVTNIINDPENEVWIKLQPGNLIVINNRRVMHGRSALTKSSGRRLVGCYISYEDFLSKHRVLSEKLNSK